MPFHSLTVALMLVSNRLLMVDMMRMMMTVITKVIRSVMIMMTMIVINMLVFIYLPYSSKRVSNCN
jgi:hypothetical protein